ncbi:MAG: polyprenyl synthetase family protein [Solobacterium sp.]|nr:polyprenyl synthetase family protein [Solobacterium sp.]
MIGRIREFDEILKKETGRITDSRLLEAMEYSLLGGGKRIRPHLLYSVLAGYGKDLSLGDPFACAIEMVHTYSLIHDDLPAMDNDELRRGKPTNHVRFGEAAAILAGDALLTYAFEVCTHSSAPAEQIVRIVNLLAHSAGPDGMVLGQVYDTLEEKDADWTFLEQTHALKTGQMFAVPLAAGAVLAERSEEEIQRWYRLGIRLGLAFQVQDDLLDVRSSAEELGKTNSDIRNNKTTGVTLLGEKRAEALMASLYQECDDDLDQFGGFDPEELRSLIASTRIRSI